MMIRLLIMPLFCLFLQESSPPPYISQAAPVPSPNQPQQDTTMIDLLKSQQQEILQAFRNMGQSIENLSKAVEQINQSVASLSMSMEQMNRSVGMLTSNIRQNQGSNEDP